MAEAPEPTPATDAVKALASFLHESPTERPSREQIQIELRKAGADMGVLRRSVQDTFDQARAQQRLLLARGKRLAMIERLKNLVPSAQSAEQIREQILAALNGFFEGGPQVAVLYRKFETASDDDLASLLEDFTLLEEFDDGEDPA